MIEKFFKQGSEVLSQLKANSLGSSLDYYAEYLSKQSRSRYTLQYYLRVAGHFNYWLKTKYISFSSVNEVTVDKFISKHLKRCFCSIQKASFNYYRPALRHFLKVLRDHHLIPLPPKPKPPPISPIDKLLLDFREHLQKVRGLTPNTIRVCLYFTRGFLKTKYKDGVINLHALNVNDVREHVITKASMHKPKSLSLLGTALRTFFRFLKMSNQIGLSLENAVPIIPVPRRLANIPKYITEEQLKCLLSSFDLSTPNGLRDRAIALLMAKMGLRVGEVAELTSRRYKLASRYNSA